ncbi:SLATT domain-containing protein [Flavobacterium psychrophilum]|uniref:SLATT domain-containing protein n=1 Tax=Flavobacterium psychrophilum TaxID=96345 RepID=UPI001C8F86B5|nr:SLATT domain-containing protein [Flavobacterium psychrophilum]EKT4499999.1 SLATT domain-containing protein [Flavobacterium psychrophilum]QZK98801.1 SLATT domain-containing protein [Flavobacterium psychrophilum]
MNEKLLANVRFYFAQSVFNSNCHFKAYNRINDKIKITSKIVASFSAITLILLILQIIGLEQKCQSLLNVLAYIGMLLTGVTLVFEMFNKEDMSFQMFQHKVFAEKYKSLRDEYMSLIEDIMSNPSYEKKQRKRHRKLQKKYSQIGENSPETTNEDYKLSQKSLGLAGNSDEEFTWSDKEIDLFLPEKLRLKK